MITESEAIQEKITVVPRGPTVELVDRLLEKSGGQNLGEVASEALFTVCLLNLGYNPNSPQDALEAFSKLFLSEQVNKSTKETALRSMATLANTTSVELQQACLETVQVLNHTIQPPERPSWKDERWNGTLGYTLSVMSDPRPIGGYTSGQLTTVVDFDIVIKSREQILNQRYRKQKDL